MSGFFLKLIPFDFVGEVFTQQLDVVIAVFDVFALVATAGNGIGMGRFSGAVLDGDFIGAIDLFHEVIEFFRILEIPQNRVVLDGLFVGGKIAVPGFFVAA